MKISFSSLFHKFNLILEFAQPLISLLGVVPEQFPRCKVIGQCESE